MDQTVHVQQENAWAIIRINRPAKRNALDRAARQSLIRAFEALHGKVSVIVLTGSDDSFCCGLDLKEREAERQAGLPDTAGQEWMQVNLAIRNHPAIFIAAVNGLTLGGGVTLINICDLAIASDNAVIGCPEIGFATYASLAGPTSQLRVSAKRAAWLLLTGNRIDAKTAQHWGMINEVIEPAALMRRACALALQVSAFDAVALEETKRALDTVPAQITDWNAAMAFGQTVNARIRQRSDAAFEGLAHFSSGGRNNGQGL